MDIVTKIVTIIGAIIAAVSGIGIMLGIKDIRSGMAHDDPKTLDKGVEKVVVGGVVAVIIGGVVLYVTGLLNAIKF